MDDWSRDVKTALLKHACTDAGQYGLNVSSADYVESGVRLLRTTDLGSGSATSDGVYLAGPIEDRFLVREGDLLMSRAGTIGQAHLASSVDSGSSFAGYLVRFRPRASVDPRFLFYTTQSQRFQDQVVAQAVVSTIANFNAERYANMPIPLPAEDQQRRIADFLDDQVARIDNLIAARRQQFFLLRDSIASGVHAAVTGADQPDRGPSRLAWATDLPTSWPSARLALVARIGTGHTPSRSHPEYWHSCNIPWLTTTDVFKFRYQQIDALDQTEVMISSLGLANSSAVIHPAGTVALSRTSGSAGFAILMGRDMATSQDFATWTPGPLLRSEYVLWCLRAMHRDLMGRLAMGSTHLTIYFPDLLSIRVPLPPLRSQDDATAEIRKITTSGRSIGVALQKSISALSELKRSLITTAVTGEFDVSSADGSQVPVA